MGLWNYLFSFKGRINRAKLWLFYLVALIFYLPALIAIKALGGFGVAWRANAFSLPTRLVATLLAAAIVALLYAEVAVFAKRVHDRDRSAWWVAIFFGPSILTMAAFSTLLFFSDPRPLTPFLSLLFLPAMILYWWGFIELHFLPGTVGDNRYGPDPLASKV